VRLSCRQWFNTAVSIPSQSSTILLTLFNDSNVKNELPSRISNKCVYSKGYVVLYSLNVRRAKEQYLSDGLFIVRYLFLRPDMLHFSCTSFMGSTWGELHVLEMEKKDEIFDAWNLVKLYNLECVFLMELILKIFISLSIHFFPLDLCNFG